MHSGEAWIISKYLSFLYLICANIFLTRNIYQKFSLFYLKALHVIEPPAKDCNWDTKTEWQILRVIAGTHISLYYCKNEKLDKSIETLINMNSLLTSLERCFSASKILYHIYASLGLLFYRMNNYHKTKKYLEKGVKFLTKFLSKGKPKINVDKEMQEQYEEELKTIEYCKLINLYLHYKICKISFNINDKECAFENLGISLKLLNVCKEDLKYVENKDSILLYIHKKITLVQKQLQEDLRVGLLEDLDELAQEDVSESYFDKKEKEKEDEENKEKHSLKKFSYKIHEPGKVRFEKKNVKN